MEQDLADRSVRFVAGILAVVGALLLAFAVYSLHKSIFGQRVARHVARVRENLAKPTPSTTKRLPSQVQMERDLLHGEQTFVKEQKMTIGAIVVLAVAAVMVTVADIIDLATLSNKDDE